ncbi:MAG: M14 family zinc carboxypeptidase [Phycisphaerae bacterium]
MNGRQRRRGGIRSRKGLALVGTAVLWSSSCISHDGGVGDRRGGAGWSAPEQRVIGTSVEGRPIELLAFGDGADCVLILATIHGDEDAGTPLVRRLAAYLSSHAELAAGRRVLLLPVANPDGLAAQTRENANGVDLNRNYPAENFSPGSGTGSVPLSEPESVAINGLLRRYRPRRIISIHQPLRRGHACIDHDGPAAGLAEAMSAHGDLPVEKIGSRPGSLGSYAGLTLGIPIITLELPKSAKGLDGESLWAVYGRMLLAAIRYPEGTAEAVAK